MKRKKVSSSLLASVGYDAEQHLLEIEFHNGTIYQYFDIPADVYADLMSADSMGSYFNSAIKDAGYAYHKVR